MRCYSKHFLTFFLAFEFVRSELFPEFYLKNIENVCLPLSQQEKLIKKFQQLSEYYKNNEVILNDVQSAVTFYKTYLKRMKLKKSAKKRSKKKKDSSRLKI